MLSHPSDPVLLSRMLQSTTSQNHYLREIATEFSQKQASAEKENARL